MRICVYCKFRYEKGSKISFHRFPTDLKIRRQWLHNMKASNWNPKERDALCSKHFDALCFVEHCNRRSLKLGSVPTIFEGNFEVPEPCLKVETVDSDDVTRENEMNEDELPITVAYDHKHAKRNPIMTENMDSRSLSSYQSPKRRGAKRLLRVANFTDSSIAAVSKYNHDHDAPRTKELKSLKVEYSVAHDHQYENTPRLYKNALQRIKKSLQVSNMKKKILARRVKRLKLKVATLKTVIHSLKKAITQQIVCQCKY